MGSVPLIQHAKHACTQHYAQAHDSRGRKIHRAILQIDNSDQSRSSRQQICPGAFDIRERPQGWLSAAQREASTDESHGEPKKSSPI
jgi:hypothetical protein